MKKKLKASQDRRLCKITEPQKNTGNAEPFFRIVLPFEVPARSPASRRTSAGTESPRRKWQSLLPELGLGIRQKPPWMKCKSFAF